ncbi:MAG TPA: hypothetical protein VKG05_09625 [Steroidobacteraceae bacterium]|nr:hypothetical protein [Steroidobacteraceae bacterium]
MTRAEGREALQRALEISRELAAVADRGKIEAAIQLDADRLQLLKAARCALTQPDEQERRLLDEINVLNARAIGALMHHQRTMARDLDMMAAGRRAMRAYAVNGQRQ